MASKDVIKRNRSTQMVLAAGQEHSGRIREKIATQYGHVFALAVVTFLAALGKVLESITSQLVTSDEELYRERGEDTDARSERDEAVGHAKDRLVTLYEDVEYMYGAGTAGSLGLQQRPPDDPDELSRNLRAVVGKLNGWTPPRAPRFAEYKWNADAWIADLTAAGEQVDAALKVVNAEKKQTDERLQIRNHHKEYHSRIFGFAATVTSQILNLIGDTELAGKVRPSTRRAGNTHAIAEEEELEEQQTEPRPDPESTVA